jgi:hypothetical protein
MKLLKGVFMFNSLKLNSAKSRMSIRYILIFFVFTFGTFSFAETTKDWGFDFDNSAITIINDSQWLMARTEIKSINDTGVIIWDLYPKNEFEACNFGFDPNIKDTALVINGEVVGASIFCDDQREDGTFYRIYITSRVYLDSVVRAFKQSAVVKVEHDLAVFNVSAIGFTKVWDIKTAKHKAPVYIDLLEGLREKAKNGDVQSQLFLGFCHTQDQDEHCPLDYNVAFKWNEMAAQQGAPDGQMMLGKMYSNGSGVAQDSKKSIKWFRKAAEQGQVFSQFQLGIAYMRGEVVPKDTVIAHMWFNLAAANGHTKAKEGREVLEGIMSQRQIEEAYSLARQCYTSNYKNC